MDKTASSVKWSRGRRSVPGCAVSSCRRAFHPSILGKRVSCPLIIGQRALSVTRGYTSSPPVWCPPCCHCAIIHTHKSKTGPLPGFVAVSNYYITPLCKCTVLIKQGIQEYQWLMVFTSLWGRITTGPYEAYSSHILKPFAYFGSFLSSINGVNDSHCTCMLMIGYLIRLSEIKRYLSTSK